MISIRMTADDEFHFYLATNNSEPGRLLGTGNNWSVTFVFEASLTPGVTNFIQVAGINTGGPAGLLGEFKLSDSQFQFANGSGTLLTNANDWKVSSGIWTTPAERPTIFGTNGQPAVWGIRSEIDAGAQWIWAANANIFYVSLSAEIRYVGAAATLTRPKPQRRRSIV